MFLVPRDEADRAFAIECLLSDLARRRVTVADADAALAQLRTIGDIHALEQVARALARHH